MKNNSNYQGAGQGGKADGLHRLSRLAETSGRRVFSVPGYVIVEPDWQPTLAGLRGLRAELRALKADLRALDDKFHHKNAGSKSLELNSRDAFDSKSACWAVRSSALGEDGYSHSFAGQFDTFLSVPDSKISRRIMDVRQSADTGKNARLANYLTVSGLAAPAMAKEPAITLYVVVQQMIDARVSGIAFSKNPMGTADQAGAIASVVAGCGDKLVSGHCNGETLRLAKDKSQLLSGSEQALLLKALKMIEREWQCPVDIEFCFADRLYIVQARPITAVNKAQSTRSTVYDASNIQESYPGTTSPLTFSFARRAYSQVYQSFVRILGVPDQLIKSRTDIFDYMLAYHQNKIYYNMQSWYGVIAMLPFYKSNRAFMEQMMGVKAGSGETGGDTVAVASVASLADKINSAHSVFKICQAAVSLKSNITDFNTRLDRALALDKSAITEMSLCELADLYLQLEGELVNRWDAPVTNDFFAMIAFGLLKSALKSYGIPDCDLHLYLRGSNQVVSARPPLLLEQIAQVIVQSSLQSPDDLQALCDKLQSGSSQAINHLQKYQEAYGLYLSYVEQFGDRSLSELKLEVPSVKDDPTVLLKTIGAMVNNLIIARQKAAADDVQHKVLPEPKYTAKGAPEHSARHALKDTPKHTPVIVRCLAHITAGLIAQRENLRFARTRVFGLVRLIFGTMGERLYEAGKLDDPRHIFDLSVDEILGFVRGTSLNLDLPALVKLRQQVEAQVSSPCRIEFEGAYGTNDFTAMIDSRPGQDTLVLKGIAASRGIVRGIARVIQDPARESLVKGEILVAERTDPGWIVHFALAAALVTDYGSLLSHTAIVSRELSLPCVVAASGATEAIGNGDYIEVDGNTGQVLILKRAVGNLLDAA